jgi:hypothetical protein
MNAISNVGATTAPLQVSQPRPTAGPAQQASASAQASTTVSISNEAKAAAAKEAAESPADTAREAGGGDRQAQNLVARRALASGATAAPVTSY